MHYNTGFSPCKPYSKNTSTRLFLKVNASIHPKLAFSLGNVSVKNRVGENSSFRGIFDFSHHRSCGSAIDGLADTWDRYGYMGGSNFADVPSTGKYTYSERAIPYIENEAAYHCSLRHPAVAILF